MTKDIHKEFKKRLFDDEITMQEFFEECAIRIVEDDAYMLKLIEHLKQKRIEKRTITSTIQRFMGCPNPALAHEVKINPHISNFDSRFI